MLHHSNGYTGVQIHSNNLGRADQGDANMHTLSKEEVITPDDIATPSESHTYFTTRQNLFGLLVKVGSIFRMMPWECVKQAVDQINQAGG